LTTARQRYKQGKFKELAENRVQKLLSGMQLLKNLSNKNNYEYTEKQTRAIFAELRRALNDTEQAFKSPTNNIPEFKLPEF